MAPFLIFATVNVTGSTHQGASKRVAPSRPYLIALQMCKWGETPHQCAFYAPTLCLSD
ncbi:MAG: hypothetical protein ACFWUG_06380 [Rahnella inusitata]|jgi:hypothetical protein